MSKRSQHDRRRNRAGMAELNQSLIVTAGIEPSGKINFAVYVIEPDEPHNHRNCVHTFNNIHQQKLDMINPKFERGAMWIAALEEIDFSDEQLLAMWETNR